MRKLDDLLMRRFGLFAAAVSFALLVAAHGFEMAGLKPCALCMNQRAIHWAAVGAGLVVGFTGRRRVQVIGLWILAAVYLFGAGMAFYDVAVEHHWVGLPRCEAAVAGGGWPFDPALSWVMKAIATPFGYHEQTMRETLTAMMNGGGWIPAPKCDKPQWDFLGLTMAGWNALISLGMALLSVRAALWKGR